MATTAAVALFALVAAPGIPSPQVHSAPASTDAFAIYLVAEPVDGTPFVVVARGERIRAALAALDKLK